MAASRFFCEGDRLTCTSIFFFVEAAQNDTRDSARPWAAVKGPVGAVVPNVEADAVEPSLSMIPSGGACTTAASWTREGSARTACTSFSKKGGAGVAVVMRRVARGLRRWSCLCALVRRAAQPTFKYAGTGLLAVGGR